MAFLSRLFEKTRTRSAVLIDIGAVTMGGALALMPEDALPEILYATRMAIAPHSGEAPLAAMSRTLEHLCATLQKDGAPLLMRRAGNGHPDDILVSVDAPWQSTELRIETIERLHPFTFTRSIVSEALRREGKTPSGQVLADESIVGTVLNGYPTARPYGRQVTQARVTVLVSHITQAAADAITATLRAAYHRESAELIAGASMRTQGVRAAFPHEHDALLVDAAGPEISIALIRRGMLAAVEDAPDGAPGTDTWVGEIAEHLKRLASKYPLPRLVFLLAPSGGEARTFTTKLGGAPMRELWLSEDPPHILPLSAEHLNAFLARPLDASADLLLGLMTVAWAHRAG